MGYINDFAKELDKRLLALEKVWRDGDAKQRDNEIADIIQLAKEKILESYRNGLQAKDGRKNFGRDAKTRTRGN